jgi:predicted nucleic acid-binding Zn ribbon protein
VNSKSKTPTSLKEIIAGIFQDSRLPFNPDDARIWKIWEEIVGPAIACNAQPSWIKEGRLRVKVSSSIWLQELNFVAEDIREKLNRKLGRRAVERIEFRLGSE